MFIRTDFISLRGSALLCLLALFLAGLASPLVAEEQELWQPSQRGHFMAALYPLEEGIPLNIMHAWHLSLRSVQGEPVSGASVEVSGGMPAHNHGLPTRPALAEEVAPGEYRLEGFRFHMPGEWQLRLRIVADELVDDVELSLEL